MLVSAVVRLMLDTTFFFVLFSRLMAEVHTIKHEEVGYPMFEPQPLHKLCNVVHRNHTLPFI